MFYKMKLNKLLSKTLDLGIEYLPTDEVKGCYLGEYKKKYQFNISGRVRYSYVLKSTRVHLYVWAAYGIH